jgi:hypothetical protein
MSRQTAGLFLRVGLVMCERTLSRREGGHFDSVCLITSSIATMFRTMRSLSR